MHRWLVGWVGLSLMVVAGWASASDKSMVVFPAEGNKTCSDYASNKVILSMGANSVVASGSVTGPDNPAAVDPDTDAETASYHLVGKVLDFTSSTPVDYVLLKSGTTVSLLIYPSGGVTSDAGMSLPGNLAISAFNLCYGLGNQPPGPPPLGVTKSCNDPNSAFLDENGIACPANPTRGRTLVCNIELDQDFFGMKDGTDTCCVCGAEPLPECDPNQPYDPARPENNACPGPTVGDANKEVTTSIEINKDPYYCTTVGGTKKCYPY